MVVCAPCLAAGPPGIAAAAVGTIGYGVYKSVSPKKKIKKTKKKLTKKKSRTKKGAGRIKFKRGEIVRLRTGKQRQNMKFVKYLTPNKISIKFPKASKKYDPTLNVNANRIEKIPKTIANTKRRQKTRRAKLVRKKRGIKSKSSTITLPSDDSVDDLMKDMKI
jgi:hypothetical protein